MPTVDPRRPALLRSIIRVTPHTDAPVCHLYYTESASIGGQKSKDNIMLRWALIFFVVAIIAAVCGFTGIAGAATEIARILFFVFLVLLVFSVLAHVIWSKPPE